MNSAFPEIDTPLALVRYTATDRVEVRFKEGMTFTVDGIAQMMRARQALGSTGPHRALMIFPEDVDFELSMISTDHYKQIPQPNTEAVAWVAQNERNAHFTRLYLAIGLRRSPRRCSCPKPKAAPGWSRCNRCIKRW